MPSVLGMAKAAVYVLVGLLVSAIIAVAGVATVSQGSEAATTVTAHPRTTTATSATATPAVVTEPSTGGLDAIDTEADFAVSVLDVESGETLTCGDGSFDTASIVKVDILAALLWQHQEAGTTMTAEERSLAAAMIERSDNAAATTLFEAVGGQAGLEAFNELIGLTDTTVGSNGNWGLTQTTAADQVRLLQVVFGEDSVLTVDSQAYEQGLMGNVVDEQNFGVSAAADDPDEAALKVGYLQRSATGLWDVTSIGEIEVGGRTYLIVVLSDGNASFDSGVELVDQVAETAVDALDAI